MDRTTKKDYDAVIVGSGPNGLAAAITLQQAGLSVLLLEAKDQVGGGLRTAELTLPGFRHDVCSAIHPMFTASPFFKSLPLEKFGLSFVHPGICAAHPFDNGTAAALYGSFEKTAQLLGTDQETYRSLLRSLVNDWSLITQDLLGPIGIPKHPLAYAKFGLNALTSAAYLSSRFKTEAGKGLWAGMAAHSIQPLSNLTTSAIALVLMAAGHTGGWPIPVGGSQSIADALALLFRNLGGVIETNTEVRSLAQLPSSHAVLLDVTPRQLLTIAGHGFSSLYKWQLEQYRYGMGVFKIDWALDDVIPFTAPECRSAGTVHIGNSFEEIAASEALTSVGDHPEKPFVLLAQQSVFDHTRAPEGKHVAWAYCHVPNGSSHDMTGKIEAQVERFAPGFQERIVGRHVMNTAALEKYNANYIGGDINGGILDIRQLFTRPALRWSPYRTSTRGIYICSSSTPPGGGVHGMCGHHAAKRALKDIFNQS